MRSLFFLLFLLSGALLSQELPPVINYGPNDYGAENQNWMIGQDDAKNLYFANGAGLLQFTGEKWNLYPVPNKTVVRSLKVIGERIYTGAYMEVGYWEKNDLGVLEYTSLVERFTEDIQDGEQFWDIEYSDGVVIFRSFRGIYLHSPGADNIAILRNDAGQPVTNLFKVADKIFFQKAQTGIYTIEKGLPEQVIPYSALGEIEIMQIFPRDGNLELVTAMGNFYSWNGQELERVLEDLSTKIKNAGLLSALKLSDDSMVLGTVGEGIYHVSEDGEILSHFDQENVLLNNTALDLYLDDAQNVWVGLDNGISVLNLDSTFRLFQDNTGKIGSVYCSFQNDDYLYLGTNQGLYYKKPEDTEFTFIEGTNGQVWSLQMEGDYLFCGHNNGTYLVNGNRAERISERLGTWLVKEIENKPGYFIQGHYNGISFLRDTPGGIEDLPMLDNFPHSSKFIEMDDDGDIWISNEHKGVFKLTISDALDSIVNSQNYVIDESTGITSSIFKFNDTLYYSSKNRILQYTGGADDFLPNSTLAKVLEDTERISGRIINDENGKIWGFAKNSIFNVSLASLSGKYELNEIYLSKGFRNITSGYENITRLKDTEYILGIADGYVKFNKVESTIHDYEVRMDQISMSALDEAARLVAMDGSSPFDYKTNNINFYFSVPVFKKFLTPVYSYRLLGQSNMWSEWDEAAHAGFKNLSFGNYTFEVRARVGARIADPLTYSFDIARPWYWSYTAIILYFLILLILLYLVHIFYKRRHQKFIEENEKALRMKNLEAQQKIIKLENERLEQDMVNKNRELAVSTMSLIKKNEFLSSIKKQLQKSESAKVKSVIRTIDKDISEEDNWKFFKKAFSNADKDFFRKIKAKHPELTSNDLKLCAYLRLNLSSKEIAPLLNISVKSVEIKRYRLRKKMDLDHETNLTDYILAL
ncbi:LuxR C-terminal-related transcriptional regulator [Zunongwangia sp. F260]|uniref:LuxR C-terminal-related transcriptional regulator n=1 Tax=Autumnicola lenta TaxID=3075593 RepID=A0ABU3CLI7_9FLAO|nr:LuxR C-terminal-related transcriptional regulator [Zunongwangia sp. F260]MDT0647161.1 LuxR C-terminal-related transcriptional regulator [Zunongwangia sp. F260]